jgi:hypothetical protein
MPSWGWRKQRGQLHIRALSPDARDRYERELRDVQMRSINDPRSAVRDADRLAQQVMSERGFPVEDFEEHAADVSADHPHVVAFYRSAHGVWLANERGGASSEDLRQALVHYGKLLDDLLGDAAEDEPLTRDTSEART